MAFESHVGHMLNCASSFCWDALISHCEEAIEILNTNLEEEDSPSSVYYEEAIGTEDLPLTKILQNQLSLTDQWGNTALHAACYNSPPVEAIRAILRVASYCLPAIKLIRSGDGSTPLLIACATGSSVDVIDLLLNGLNGGDDNDDEDEIIDINNKMRKLRGIEASIPDHRGNTPLSELCQNYETQRKSVGRHSYHGSTSVHSHPNLETVQNVDEACERCNTFSDFWKKVICILEAGTRDLPDFLQTKCNAERNQCSESYTCTTLLHKCAAMAAFCPLSIAKIICNSTPVNAQGRNELGWLPLHLAIISEEFSSSKPFRRYQHHSLLAHNRTEIIRKLLDMYPEAARIAIPGDGRTPLCAAIASGLEWHLGSSSSTSKFSDVDDENDGKCHGPLWHIWKHSPESHSSRDVVTGLYPFMLAASINSMAFQVNLDRKYEGEYMEKNIDTIYSLLRLHPQIIQECCVLTSKEFAPNPAGSKNVLLGWVWGIFKAIY